MDTSLTLKKDLATFLVILAIVLTAIIALYYYNQATGMVSTFSSQLFSWLVD